MPALVILYTIWDLLVISASANLPILTFSELLFFKNSYQCPAQCLLEYRYYHINSTYLDSREALTHMYIPVVRM